MVVMVSMQPAIEFESSMADYSIRSSAAGLGQSKNLRSLSLMMRYTCKLSELYPDHPVM